MLELSIHQKRCKRILNQLVLSQNKMLYLELSTASKKFDQTYKDAIIYFEGFVKQLQNVKKGTPYFLLKKQAQLSLRNLKMLQEENIDLVKFNDKTIIRYFEKQLIFKKVLKRQLSHPKQSAID